MPELKLTKMLLSDRIMPKTYEIKSEKLLILEDPCVLVPKEEQIEKIQHPETRLLWRIKETCGVAQYSKTQQCIHLKSGLLDYIPMEVTITNPPENEYFLDLHLRRTDSRYSHYPVDRCCKKHETLKTENNYPITGTMHDKLLKGKQIKGVLAENHQTPHTSLRFKTRHLTSKNNESCGEIKLLFACNDSCADSSHKEFMPNKEKSRDMELLINLTERKGDKEELICSEAIKIWLKAVVRHKDLVKEQRREPKGGQANIYLKRKLNNILYPNGIGDELFVSLIRDKLQDEEIPKDKKFKILEMLNISPVDSNISTIMQEEALVQAHPQSANHL